MKKSNSRKTPLFITLFIIFALPFFAAAQNKTTFSSSASADEKEIAEPSSNGANGNQDQDKKTDFEAEKKIDRQPAGGNNGLEDDDGQNDGKSEKEKNFKLFLKDRKSKRYV
jgi:hypothetical protein